LHIWKDWFNTFSQEVQTFLKLLADEVWMKGENELLLDDLLNNEKLKQYLTSDLVNSPYARMKNMGWVSRYVKDMNGCLGFTVEGALLYLLGVKLQEQEPKIELSYIQNILSSGTKLQQSAIESFLCEQALAGDLDLVTTLIDAGSEKLDLCIRPLLYYLKAFGVEATINNILENPTENDWIAMLELDKKMLELQLQAMRKSFLIELKTKNYLNDKNAILLGVRSIIILEKDDAVFYYNKIINTINLNEDNLSVIRELAIVEKRFSNYRESIEKFERYINIFKKKNGEVNLDIAHTYNDIGITYIPLGEYKKALFFFEKSLALYLSIQGEFNNDTASVYGNIGWTYYKRKEYDKALFYYEKGKEICIKTVGHNHKLFSFFINNIGLVLDNSGEFKKAIENYEIALSINLKLLNNGDPDIAANLTNIGISWDKIGDFKKAIEYKEKGLEIVLNFYGENHPALSNNYNNLGVTYCNMGDYKKALFFYEKSLDIRIRSFGENHPDLDFNYFNIASTWYTLKNYPKAMFYYNKCLVIRIDCFGEHHPLVAETYNYLADVHCDIGEYFKAIEMYNKSLDIFHKNPNSGYLDHSTYYFNIGFCLQNIEKFQQAIEAFSNGFEIQKKGGFLFRIAQCYESLGNLNDALRYYIESAEIRKEDPECGLENESTIGSIKNTKRLAKELGKEIELPEWIKN
jgi:tetratricopeptide (TPR) repeat protein